MVMGCDEKEKEEDTRVVAEQYRGIFLREGFTNGFEFTESQRFTIYEGIRDKTLPAEAWTVENALWTKDDYMGTRHMGNFIDNDTYYHIFNETTYKRKTN